MFLNNRLSQYFFDMANEAKAQQPQNGGNNGVDEAQIRQESGRAAEEALKLQHEAWELRQAAHGAADAEERQKLLEQAIDREIAAESFGKTAKYMRSGTFQGMAVGAGLGVAPAATLGTLTGTLVGGLTSLITGGLGGGIGALTGLIHGPFWNTGELAGKGIQKVTGNWWSREATDEQKQTLEKMMHQANETKMPGKEELQSMRSEFSGGGNGKSWTESAKSMMPTMPWSGSKQDDDSGNQSKPSRGVKGQQSKATSQQKERGPPAGAGRSNSKQGTRADDNAVHQLAERRKQPQRSDGIAKPSTAPQQGSTRDKPQPAASEPSAKADDRQGAQQAERKKPRKLQVRSDDGNARPNAEPATEKKKPRKLETRS
ncbi:hypothetical protein CLAFUW4_05030 [Fulvia fulva]|uniref:Uncharacterized protein n=1 Tax=Passalora fulva TaxID=5499 RepID=A0A9Q8UUK1_PASFU|nr:uncharacterized protein CLAFUR5_11877 [Fulvia fulva]KAK4626686.1 hypothetical protein CLAFUR4_05016 [Fulvia fulva]KAK4628313.1 hypothetical protein CLAFUR0_05020 [Fulvia fulva]UJO22988.1 hypothetical protein CLAFUR5_11877 [Fulvia fulva]WPV13530.1 hypothetical protein CLAFUW4_05030 [Fulvia fulva]WPV28866.1 hypothetical protein CLAFUW7_05024 [Fulvia fulva]